MLTSRGFGKSGGCNQGCGGKGGGGNQRKDGESGRHHQRVGAQGGSFHERNSRESCGNDCRCRFSREGWHEESWLASKCRLSPSRRILVRSPTGPKKGEALDWVRTVLLAIVAISHSGSMAPISPGVTV